MHRSLLAAGRKADSHLIMSVDKQVITEGEGGSITVLSVSERGLLFQAPCWKTVKTGKDSGMVDPPTPTTTPLWGPFKENTHCSSKTKALNKLVRCSAIYYMRGLADITHKIQALPSDN